MLNKDTDTPTVLIVDDYAPNREYLSVLLGYRGYHLLEAGDGAEALERIRAGKPDLVIADILMPTMDGYQLVKHLRAEPGIARTPVIFCSAVYHEQEARDLARSCGVEHVLTKPCNPETVLQTIEEQLGRPPVPATTQADFDREHQQLLTNKLHHVAEHLEQVDERLADLIETNLELASERDPQRLLRFLCHQSRNLIGARFAILAVGGKDADAVRVAVTSGVEATSAGDLYPLRLQQGILKEVVQEREPRRGTMSGGDPAVLGLPAGYPPVHSYLVAPIISLRHTYGWICLTDRIGDHEFTDEDESLLNILAMLVGRIYENGSLYAELQEKEERFRQLVENINEVFYLRDPKASQMLYVSPAYESIWGRSCESLYDNPHSWMESVHPDDRPLLPSILKRAETEGKLDTSYRIVRPDGGIRWIRSTAFPVRDDRGRLHRVAGIAEDITAAREAELRILRLNRVYAVLSAINMTIVQAREHQALYDEACRICVDEGGFRLAWIGTVSADGVTLEARAVAGHEDGYMDYVIRSLTDEPAYPCPCRESVVTGENRVVNDIENLDPGLPWRQPALDRGYRSAAALPLRQSGRSLGVLCLYAGESDFFDEEELRLLDELAGDLAFSIEFIENEQRLNFLAYRNPLTGLANRVRLYQVLNETISAQMERPAPFALILIDINGFQDINDTLGHHNGDELLKLIARRLTLAVWDRDLVAHLGGDEFAVLLPHLAAQRDIQVVIDKILQAFRSTFVIADIPLHVDISLGGALYPDHARSADALWQYADVALRVAKESHLVHQLYCPEIDHYDPQKLTLIGELSEAIDRDELVLHYQPKIDLQRECVIGVEALVRWQHPDKGLLPPDQFIPLIEHTSLMGKLSLWVMTRAVHQLSDWDQAGHALELAVNLSVHDLREPGLIEEIHRLLTGSGLDLQRLVVEITESAIMVDPVRTQQILVDLRQSGVRISIDDFGQGQTSLSHLKQLPVQQLKVDKQFVRNISDTSDAAIARSVIELGHNLQLEVIAEGVEDEAAYAYLRETGCDQAQGYFFSRPLPPEEFMAWLDGCTWRKR